jgi:hypothetical protein
MIVTLDGQPYEVPPELAAYCDRQQDAVAAMAAWIVKLEAELAAKQREPK